jgi:hypothetical protein
MSVNEEESRVFTLTTYGYRNNICGVVITPTPTQLDIVIQAWSYAVRYTAKGIDLPDYEAAAKLMKARHPTWDVLAGNKPLTAGVELHKADLDQSEA